MSQCLVVGVGGLDHAAGVVVVRPRVQLVRLLQPAGQVGHELVDGGGLLAGRSTTHRDWPTNDRITRLTETLPAATALDTYAYPFDDDLDAVADRLDAVVRKARGLLADSLRTGAEIVTLSRSGQVPAGQ